MSTVVTFQPGTKAVEDLTLPGHPEISVIGDAAELAGPDGRPLPEARGRRLWGLPAFVMYMAVHLFYLGGVGGPRLTAGINALQALFGARANRVIGDELQLVKPPRSTPRKADKPTPVESPAATSQ